MLWGLLFGRDEGLLVRSGPTGGILIAAKRRRETFPCASPLLRSRLCGHSDATRLDCHAVAVYFSNDQVWIRWQPQCLRYHPTCSS